MTDTRALTEDELAAMQRAMLAATGVPGTPQSVFEAGFIAGLRYRDDLLRDLASWLLEASEMVHRREVKGDTVHTDPFDQCGSVFCREARDLARKASP